MTRYFYPPSKRMPESWTIVELTEEVGQYRVISDSQGNLMRSTPIVKLVNHEKYFELFTVSGSHYILIREGEFEFNRLYLKQISAETILMKDLIDKGGVE